MSKLFASFFFFLLISSSSVTSAQNSHSIEINGGIISPMSSSNGLTASVQFNYSYSSTVNFYLYSGYSSWDKYNVTFYEDYSEIQKKQFFQTYSEDDHVMIPVFLGAKINFHTTKFFTTYIDVEVGYANLSYNSYSNRKIVDPETGEVLKYTIDPASKREVNDNLFGIGIGAGLSHPITKYLNLILSFKLNSFLNSGYGLFSSKGTYTAFLAGFNFNI